DIRPLSRHRDPKQTVRGIMKFNADAKQRIEQLLAWRNLTQTCRHNLLILAERYYEGPGGCLSGTIIVSHTLEEEMDHGAPYDPSGSDSGTSLHDGVIRGIGAQ